MSKKFYLLNKETGEKFKSHKNEFVVLYDTGYPAIVSSDGFYTYIKSVDLNKYTLVIKDNLK